MIFTLSWNLNLYTSVMFAFDIINLCTTASVDGGNDGTLHKIVCRVMESCLTDFGVLKFCLQTRALAAILCAMRIQLLELEKPQGSKKRKFCLSLSEEYSGFPEEFFLWQRIIKETSLGQVLMNDSDETLSQCETRMMSCFQSSRRM